MEGRERNGRQVEVGKSLGKRSVVAHDPLEPVLVESHQVDLVDREHNLPDAHEGTDGGMPSRLGEDALFGIDQDYGGVAAGRAGRHVAGVLFVSRRVGDQEGAARRRKVPPSNVDGDALFALGLEAVEQPRIVDRCAVRAVATRVGRERREMVVEHLAGLGQEAADQGRFAVVDRSAGEEAEGQGVAHQK